MDDATATRHFLLVHGAWHGGWAWDEVAARLVDRGHRVTAPTLPTSPDTRLRHHVEALVRALEQAREPVVLVAHSYAGIVATQAAARARHRVARLVLVDGWLARAGQSLFDVAPDWFVDWCTEAATGPASHAVISPPPAATLGITDDALARWLEPRLTPQPIATFSDPVAEDLPAGIQRDAIVCVPPTMPFAELARAAGFALHEIESGHEPMLTRPGEVARMLDGLAGATESAA